MILLEHSDNKYINGSEEDVNTLKTCEGLFRSSMNLINISEV